MLSLVLPSEWVASVEAFTSGQQAPEVCDVPATVIGSANGDSVAGGTDGIGTLLGRLRDEGGAARRECGELRRQEHAERAQRLV